MKRRALLVALAFAVGAAPAAQAGHVWREAVADPQAAATREAYAQAIAQGDAWLLQAARSVIAGDVAPAELLAWIGQATAAYRRAMTVTPDHAEAAYRLATTLHTFLVNCPEPLPMTRACRLGRNDASDEALSAWDAFTRLAPLDPRATGLLFTRALERTRRVGGYSADTEARLRAAIADYEAHLARFGTRAGDPAQANLAEMYMMLGDLEHAIDTYRAALGGPSGTSAIYGLAVALDRDEQGALAREVARSAGADAFEAFRRGVAAGDPFFVPHGEHHYYFAVVAEALGDAPRAIREYDAFVASGADPRWNARALANRDALVRRFSAPAVQPPPPPANPPRRRPR